jgi:hypothetical protein
MPAYQAAPALVNAPPPQLVPGVPAYAFGSRALGPTRRLAVTTTASAGGTATLGVKVLEGNIPAVGDLISVAGTQQQGGAFNVTNAALTAVSIVAATGVGTVQFALAGATASAADPGVAVIPVPEIGEALTNTSSQAFGIQEVSGMNDNTRTITWSTVYPTAPATVTMALQASLFDIDSQYQTLDTSTNAAGEERFTTLTNFRFLRFKASGVTGANPTAIVKLLT